MICPGCQQRDERIAALEREVAQLRATVLDLTAHLGTNATNSGTPPSANPLGAPKPVVKKQSRRRPGGQPGHPPRLKQLLPPERVQRTFAFMPRQCRRCLVADGINSSTGRIQEFTTSGQLVQTLHYTRAPGDTDPRGIIVDGNGNIQIYNGTFTPYLTTLNPTTGQIVGNTTVSGWSTVANPHT